MPVAVVAIGGNSLIKDEAHPTFAGEVAALEETSVHIAEMLARGWDLVLTHGNGPQVGFNLLRSELAAAAAPPLPLDALGAQTQGSIGYVLQQVLGNELRRRGIRKSVATVVTQVVVDPQDPAFLHPTKPIGRFYPKDEADRLASQRGWRMVEDAGRGWRRVVPSPRPVEIVEAPVITDLAGRGVVVIACGGGGIPVVRQPDGRLAGVEAVIDKDLASALLARVVAADLLLISTAVDRVYLDYGRPTRRPVATLTAGDARRHLADGQFPAGSMGPKIEAAIRFLEGGGRQVLITSPEHIVRALDGQAGTRIVPG